MQIVIDVDETIFKRTRYEYYGENEVNHSLVNEILISVINGTVLPKECNIQRIIPKRVDVQKWIYTKCPNLNCNYELSTHHGDGYYSIEHKPDFCPNCGQALLWEIEE